MKLSEENYFSQEASEEYISCSQYKDFMGSLGRKGCQFAALAKIKGDYKLKVTVPMLIGSYVDSNFSGTLDTFKGQHAEILKKDGSLLAPFQKANEVIERIERDPLFLKYISGEMQNIFIGEIGGAKWKCKVDSLYRDNCIVDLKVMRSLRKLSRVKDFGYVTFIEFWGIEIQGAIYQEIVKQNIGKKLPFFIAGVSKEDYIDMEIISIEDYKMKNALIEIESNVERIIAIKNGNEKPTRCEKCDWCRETRVLTHPISSEDLLKTGD